MVASTVMGWDSFVAGEIRFPKAADVAAWLASEGVLPKLKWTEFLRHTVDPDADSELEESEGTVEQRIETCKTMVGSFFVDIDGARVGIQAFVGKDEHWGIVNDVVRIVGAAVGFEASGEVRLCYAGTGFGHEAGAVLSLDKGKLATKGIPTGGADKDVERAIFERAQAFWAAPKKKAAKKKSVKKKSVR
jgi:hypothetical protein